MDEVYNGQKCTIENHQNIIFLISDQEILVFVFETAIMRKWYKTVVFMFIHNKCYTGLWFKFIENYKIFTYFIILMITFFFK